MTDAQTSSADPSARCAGPGELRRGEAVLPFLSGPAHLSGEGRSEESQQIQELREGIPVEGWPRTKLVRSSVGQGQCGWHATTEGEEEEEQKTGEEMGRAVHAGSPIKIVFFVALLWF